MFILHTTFAPEAVFALTLPAGYCILVFLAYRRRPTLWASAVLGTYIALIIIAAADEKLETIAELPAKSAWVLLQAGSLLVLPGACLIKAVFSSGEWLQRVGWLTMFTAASAVFTQACVFRFDWDGWETIRGLSQILFVASALTFAAIFVTNFKLWRRRHEELGMFDESASH